VTRSRIPERPRASFLGRVLILGLIGALVLALPSATLARKPGGSGGTGSATVTASPNPVAAGAALTISGSGYRATTQLQVQIVTSVSIGYLYAASDASGSFSLQTSIATPGTAKISVWQSGRRKSTLMASTSVTVQ